MIDHARITLPGGSWIEWTVARAGWLAWVADVRAGDPSHATEVRGQHRTRTRHGARKRVSYLVARYVEAMWARG